MDNWKEIIDKYYAHFRGVATQCVGTGMATVVPGIDPVELEQAFAEREKDWDRQVKEKAAQGLEFSQWTTSWVPMQTEEEKRRALNWYEDSHREERNAKYDGDNNTFVNRYKQGRLSDEEVDMLNKTGADISDYKKEDEKWEK